MRRTALDPAPLGRPYYAGGHIPHEPRAIGSWVLDRYQLRKELHSGSNGELWLAREKDTRELYVARIGLGVLSSNVQTEGDVLSRLKHPGIPRLIDQGPVTGETSGWCTICEYIDGATLGKVLRVASPAPPRAAGWARQLALAVAQVHEIGIVHGDLHPDHVIVGRDNVGRDRLVLVGFGTASPAGAPRRGPTPAHWVAAPEVLLGGNASPEADLYALGAILYRMLAERWPFTGAEPQVHEAHVSTPPPPLGRHSPALRLPPGLELLVFRCLAKDPAERVSSARELADALGTVAFAPQRDWIPVTGTSDGEPRLIRPTPEPPRGGLLPGIVLGMLITMLIALGLYLAG